MRSLWREFKAFAVKGSFLDLAVAVVLGVAFNAVVQSLVDDVIGPLIAATVGEPNFEDLTVGVGEGVVRYGAFLTAVVNLLIVAVVLFLIVKAYRRATTLRDAEPEVPTTRPCPRCLTDIPLRATRCPACTSEVEAAA
jgi:large conductance mechanosensitive channel